MRSQQRYTAGLVAVRSRTHRSFLIVVAFGVACGGESRVERREGFGDVPPVSVDNLAEITAASFCGPLEACCGAWRVPYDAAGCEAALEAYFAPAAELVRSGGALLDETSARRCIAELTASLSSCTLENPPSCRRALAGTTPEGEPCARDEVCAEAVDGEARCLDETCSLRPRARLGDVCRETCREEMELREGFWPAYAYVFCQLGALSASGACFRNDGLYCPRATGRCEPLLAEGSACTEGACQMHLHCDDGICRPRAAEGESCPATMSSQVEPECSEGLSCSTDDRCLVNPNAAPLFDPAETVCGG